MSKIKKLGDIAGELLELQCLIRVIQDSAEFSSMRIDRKESPEAVLDDIERSLQIAIDRCGDIATDIQVVESELHRQEQAAA